ncbi:hypothetical protein BOX15_Mlig010378g2 [Macrostomum lignano]|uniref:ArfGAP with SH3 domain, ANK repeat and PH domain-containing protein n=1 Tax=Macrostomum lignano TaxID=282301 RepID=A0A267DZT5_9PLAT|nr:hypothetical protein BOX15_Mlig010378g2 [Macrostomum lignano]
MPEQVVRIGVTDFVTYTYEDLQDATNSRFIQKILQLRKTVDSISYDLDLDKAALNKVRKSVKAVYGSGKSHIQSESDLSNLLAELGNYAIDEGADSVGSALSKFSVVTKETNSYFANLMQNLSNIVLSPLETFIKVEMKSDMKKGFDKALKEYESKFDKIRKEKIQAAKEAGHTKTDVSMTEIQEELERERRSLQLQLCEFFIKANDVKTKKRSGLMQYLIDYYTAQMMYFEESVKTLKHLGCYMQDMVGTVEELRSEQDEERRTLVRLRDELRTAMAEKETVGVLTSGGSFSLSGVGNTVASSAGGGAVGAASGSAAAAAPGGTANSASSSSGAGYSLHQSQGNRAHGTCKIGYLMKRSEGKVKRVWQKRRATVDEDRFLLYHADESKPPVSLLLLTCQVRQSPEDRSKRAFRLISNNRTYYFQCDSGPEAEHWVSVLNNAKEKVFQAAMGAPLSSGAGVDGSDGVSNPSENLRAAIIREIRNLPGNNVCADCCAPDPEWMSTNLGVLICLECCGIHRDLGVHISRTQSLVMDDLTTAQLLVSRFVGNKMFNEVFEAVMPENVKPRAALNNSVDLQQLMDTRKIFIRVKYVDRCYVFRTVETSSDSPDSVEGLQSLKSDLLKAVRHQNMPLLLQAFAEGCDLLAQYSNGETAVHILLREGDESICLAIVDFILQNSPASALKRATVSTGETLLHYCVNYNRPDCLKLCLRTSLSASAVARNHAGLTAADICKQLSFPICADLLRSLENGNTAIFENVTNFEWRLSGAGGVSGADDMYPSADYFSDDETASTGAGAAAAVVPDDFPQLRTLTSSSGASGGGVGGGGSATLAGVGGGGSGRRRGWSYYPSPSKSVTSTPKATPTMSSASPMQQQSSAASTAPAGSYGSGFVTLPRRPSKVKKAPPPPQQPPPPSTSSTAAAAAAAANASSMSMSLYGSESIFKSPLPANPSRSATASASNGGSDASTHRQLRRAGSYDNIDVIIDALMEDPAGENDNEDDVDNGEGDRRRKRQPQPHPRHTLHKAVPDSDRTSGGGVGGHSDANRNWSSPKVAPAAVKYKPALSSVQPQQQQQQQQKQQQQPAPPKRAPKPKIDKSLLLNSSSSSRQSQAKPQQQQPTQQQKATSGGVGHSAPIASSDSDAESARQSSLPSSPQQAQRPAAAAAKSTPAEPITSKDTNTLTRPESQTLEQSPAPAAPSSVAASSTPVRCVAMYDCQAEFPNELSFAKGEVLRITRQENEDWWEAEVESEPSRRGLFPVSFVHFLT